MAAVEPERYEYHDGQPEYDSGLIPRPLPLVASLLAITGLAVSIYLTLVHYTSTVTLVCSANATVNCEKVVTSPQSVIFGIPVAVFGLPFFAASLVLNLPVAWRSALVWVRLARLVLAISGVGFVLYLIYTELLVIDAICLWCTAAHVLAFGLFILVVWGTTRLGLGFSQNSEHLDLGA